ncbi:protein of unknown function [Vibrio tapetis subsp. tapetis]|uniref:Uncharacterized protein n=1 Tax=Vibrio tapetis subsp. tapetis TaxID=1671868 RepID=A0A2N8ZBK5_9VIBR|nr:protein of unknown function [Vibrio tapetis subsp. tapetis]
MLIFSAYFNVLIICYFANYLKIMDFNLIVVYLVNNFELSHCLDETLHLLTFFYIKIKF